HNQADHRIHQAGRGRHGGVGTGSPARLQSRQLLRLAGQVRRHGGRGRQAPEGARGREQPAQAVAGRRPSGYRGAEDRLRGKTLAPQRKREAVLRMLDQTVLSERRACRLAGLSRDSFRHPPEPTPATQALSARIIELARVRRRFGYRRLHDLLRPEFPDVNHKKIYRLYSEASLAVRRRKKAKRPPLERQPLAIATAPNAVWSMDFVSDALANARRLKCLTVADDFTHECVDITVDHGIGGAYVVASEVSISNRDSDSRRTLVRDAFCCNAQDPGPQKRDPPQQPAQVVARRAGDHVQGIALGSLEVAASQPAVVLQMADHWLHRLPSLHPGPLTTRQRLRLAPVQYLHAFHLTTAIAQVDDCRLRLLPADNLHLLKLLVQRVAVVRIACKTPCTDHQPLPGRYCNAHLHPELVGLARLALADALHLR